MFAFVISLVVVGTAVVLAIRIVLKSATEQDQPATPRPHGVRGPSGGAPALATSPAAPAPIAPLPDWTYEPLAPSLLRRVRSAFLLIVIVTVLGALTALLLVIGGAILLSGVRNAVQ